MALEDLAGVFVLEGSAGGLRDLEEQVHANGKIWTVEKARLCRRNQIAQTRELIVPACCANDHILSRVDASLGIGNDGRGHGEIDDAVKGREKVGGEGASVGVFDIAQGVDVMAAFAGYVCH